MVFKVELKLGECIIIGDSVIINDNQWICLFIEGQVFILWEKDIFILIIVDILVKWVYLVVQLMYLLMDLEKIMESYFIFVNDIVKVVLSMILYVIRISNVILFGFFYKVLKEV